MLGVIATDMIVAGGRSLYRPLEEAERQRGLGHRGVGEGETTEGQGPSVFGTEGRAEQSEVMKEPLAAGENEFKDAAVDTVPSGPMARVAAIKSEVKTEPNVKVEYDGGPASDIPEACEWLMFKDMYRPVEEDDEFSDDESTKKKKTETPVLASVDALVQPLQSFMQQQQQLQEQMTRNRWQGSRSPMNRASMVAAVTASSSSGNGGTAQSNNRPFRGISMGDDSRTQDGVPVCGRVDKWVTSVPSVNQTLVVATVITSLVDEDLGVR
ncbi:hypothetical protein PC110_g21336 [Phytophthora cactorum]|uniref:Uncharacterized protein n=1 Tax=Phytophthora cactorum TaxID=29920 RepID=A0A329RCC7_9STRA|nr:hypothetical protein PC110_g21336 [Phytophthora cactorum]